MVVSQPGFGGQHGPDYPSRDGQEIKVGDYISFGFDPRKKGFPITQEFIDNLKKVTGFKEIGGVLYPPMRQIRPNINIDMPKIGIIHQINILLFQMQKN